MRKIQAVVLALFAVLALGAMAVTSASAAELLSNGLKIEALLPLQISGELLLEDMKASVLGNPDLLCSGILKGWIEPGGQLGFIEELLMLDGTLLNELGVLNGAGNDMIDCTDHNNICSGGAAEAVLLTALNLLWHFEIELLTFLEKDVYALTLLRETEKVPAYEETCETSFGTITDVCETEAGTNTSALLENKGAEGLLGELRESEEDGITLAGRCSVGGAKQVLLQGDGFITDPEGGALTVSE